jgi:hypothetical protein
VSLGDALANETARQIGRWIVSAVAFGVAFGVLLPLACNWIVAHVEVTVR